MHNHTTLTHSACSHQLQESLDAAEKRAADATAALTTSAQLRTEAVLARDTAHNALEAAQEREQELARQLKEETAQREAVHERAQAAEASVQNLEATIKQLNDLTAELTEKVRFEASHAVLFAAPTHAHSGGDGKQLNLQEEQAEKDATEWEQRMELLHADTNQVTQQHAIVVEQHRVLQSTLQQREEELDTERHNNESYRSTLMRLQQQQVATTAALAAVTRRGEDLLQELKMVSRLQLLWLHMGRGKPATHN